MAAYRGETLTFGQAKTGQPTARDQELHGDLTWRGGHESARRPITASPHR